MPDTSNLSEDDLVQLIQLNFALLAENFAGLAQLNPDKSTMKLHTTAEGFEVSCAIMARSEARDG